jgi:hypothetical protein
MQQIFHLHGQLWRVNQLYLASAGIAEPSPRPALWVNLARWREPAWETVPEGRSHSSNQARLKEAEWESEKECRLRIERQERIAGDCRAGRYRRDREGPTHCHRR